jgi:hypothetical protein
MILARMPQRFVTLSPSRAASLGAVHALRVSSRIQSSTFIRERQFSLLWLEILIEVNHFVK